MLRKYYSCPEAEFSARPRSYLRNAAPLYPCVEKISTRVSFNDTRHDLALMIESPVVLIRQVQGRATTL